MLNINWAFEPAIIDNDDDKHDHDDDLQSIRVYKGVMLGHAHRAGKHDDDDKHRRGCGDHHGHGGDDKGFVVVPPGQLTHAISLDDGDLHHNKHDHD